MATKLFANNKESKVTVNLMGNEVIKAHESWKGLTLAEVCDKIGATDIKTTSMKAKNGEVYDSYLRLVAPKKDYVIRMSKGLSEERDILEDERLGNCVVNINQKPQDGDADGEFTGDFTMSLGKPTSVVFEDGDSIFAEAEEEVKTK